jgi:hypothetical protein
MHGDNAPADHEEPEEACVELPDVPQLEQTPAKCLRKRLAVIVAMTKLRKPCEDDRKVVGIAVFQCLEKFLNGTPPLLCFVKLYSEFHFLGDIKIDVVSRIESGPRNTRKTRKGSRGDDMTTGGQSRGPSAAP